MKKILLASVIGGTLLFAGCGKQQPPAVAMNMNDSHRMPNGEMMMNDDMQGMPMASSTMQHDGAMTMDDMVNMLKGKTGDALDKAFLEGMIPHHQGAIDMANYVLENASHEEIRQMAREIISAQQREIDMMQQWQKDWGYTQ